MRGVSEPGAPDARATAIAEAASPVRDAGDPKERPVRTGIALCLSGGGYRAMLFHLGALWRLNELGYLPRLDRVSSVSGGSITAGALGHAWPRLDIDERGVARAFDAEVVAPLRRLGGRTIDIPTVLLGALLPGSIGSRLAGAYSRHLFGEATLQDLPDRPRFVLNATNLQSGVLWRFSKPYMADYRVGTIERPTTRLALAVAASSAFPPVLSPVRPTLDPASYSRGDGTLEDDVYRRRPMLTDGGVYDNLGLETAWKRHGTILVSDGGGQYQAQPNVRGDWLRQTRRVIGTIDSQVRALRKRQVIGGLSVGAREGAYWSIWSEVADFRLADALDVPDERAKELAHLATRLKKLDPPTQERLVNWGYAVCDTAMRKHVEPGTPRPDSLPYPATGI
jgi:NTE family protein